jgi:hypothetical protein
MSSPPPAPEPARPRGRGVFAGAVVVVIVLGLLVGIVTGTEATQAARLGTVRISLGAVAAFVFTAGFGAFAGWGLGGREMAALPGMGWLGGVLVLIAVPRPGGDIWIPGSGADVYGFLFAGFAGVLAAVPLAARLLRRRAAPDGRDAEPSPTRRDGR